MNSNGFSQNLNKKVALRQIEIKIKIKKVKSKK